jgi:amino-acid N-acetyltransferase
MAEPLIIRGRPQRSTAVAMLQTEGLPASDLSEAHLEHFFFTGSESSPTALVGLEIYGSDALLRSLVVSASARARGIGSSLVLHAEVYASSRHVRAIYLLTTTAASFFERLGYQRIERTFAPASIRCTREFSDLCPTSSAFMIKRS